MPLPKTAPSSPPTPSSSRPRTPNQLDTTGIFRPPPPCAPVGSLVLSIVASPRVAPSVLDVRSAASGVRGRGMCIFGPLLPPLHSASPVDAARDRPPPSPSRASLLLTPPPLFALSGCLWPWCLVPCLACCISFFAQINCVPLRPLALPLPVKHQ
ncbi:hypothetical protein RJ55_02874 [Drechmeria coniospora]|nr:hypothetical protein RJ55_02874 [Drechmeria coniospora]